MAPRAVVLLAYLACWLPSMWAARTAAEAQALIKGEKFAEASVILKSLADRDEPDALMLLGLLEATGAGVARDTTSAQNRWARAAHLGQRDAIRLLIPQLHIAFQRSWWLEQLAAAAEPAVKVPLNLVRQERAWLAANEAAALAWNEERAARGDPMALYNLFSFRCHHYEWMVMRKEELLASLKKAALAEYAPALKELADLYTPDPSGVKDPMRLVDPDPKLSSTYMQRAADLGDDGAQLLWAHRLSSGRHGVEKNEELAAEYYQRSSDQGNVYAPFFLFEAYSEGEGVPKDDALALANLKLAAARDNDLAASILGRRLFAGNGLPIDHVAGVTMLLRSLVTETVPDEDDIAIVASGLFTGHGLAKDEAAAFKWAEWGASKGSVAAKFQMGCQHMDGLGVPKDQPAGFALWLAAAEEGAEDAPYYAGVALLQGWGVAKDVAAAAKWLEETRSKNLPNAANASFVLAQLKMGAHGSSDYDPAAAKSLLLEAIDRGQPEAKLPLVLLENEGTEPRQAHERITQALSEALAAQSPYATTLLAHYGGDLDRLVRQFVQRSEPPPEEAEVTRRISALGVVPLNSMPRPVYQSAPRYPYLLSAVGREGEATIEFIINEEGRVIEARIVDATHTVFGEAALHAVQGWRFAPGMKDGRRVATRVKQLLEFRLEDTSAEGAK